MNVSLPFGPGRTHKRSGSRQRSVFVSLTVKGPATPGRKPASPAVIAANEKALTGALFDSALPGELENLDDAGRAAIAHFVVEAAAERLPGGHIVHLDTAEVDDAAPGAAPRRRRMALAIIGEDRPFLVDSTSATITAAGLDIERLLHPVIDVRRDADGVLIEVIGPCQRRRSAAGITRESMIYVEIERAGAKARGELVARAANRCSPMSMPPSPTGRRC